MHFRNLETLLAYSLMHTLFDSPRSSHCAKFHCFPLCAGACLAHAEWAPVGRMHKAGLLEAWSYLLTTPEFRMTACDVLRQLASQTQSKVGSALEGLTGACKH